MNYEQAVEFHHRLEAFYPLVEERGAYIRKMRPVSSKLPLPPHGAHVADHDRVFCALAIRAATTKRAVLALAESGDGDSAMVLARVVLENAILMGWMLGGEGLDRLETYILFMAVLNERLVQIVETFYDDNPTFVKTMRSHSDPFAQAIARDVFGGKDDTWAYFPRRDKPSQLRRVGVKAMFTELQGGKPSFAYEMPYVRCSQFVHSGPLSLASILPHLLPRRTFVMAPMPSRDTCGEALELSNIAMLLVLGAMDDYLGSDFGERIKTLQAEIIAASADPAR